MSHVSVAPLRGVLSAARFFACGLALAVLAGCGASRLDGVPVAWTGFRDTQPMVLPSDPAQCPDLAGVYLATGEYRSGNAQSKVLADLYGFLAHSLQLQGVRGEGQPEWRPSPQATVTFAPGAQGWQVQAQDGQGARFTAPLPLLNGARDPDDADAPGRPLMPNALSRYTGCTEGRLWVSVRYDWRQHEAMGVRRHVALFRPLEGGLLVSVQRESDTIGLLPWYSNDADTFQYWFAPASPRELGGNAEAQYLQAMILEHVDIQGALRWYEAAATQGHLASIERLRQLRGEQAGGKSAARAASAGSRYDPG